MSLIPRSTRFLTALVVFALASGVGTALAARGEPQKKLTPADNARARSMLVKKPDLGPGFKAKPASPNESDFYCKPLDESDLTLTGEADSADFTRGAVIVSSFADIYESVRDANASWRRGTSAAGHRCLRDGVRHELSGPHNRFVSFRKIAFPRVAQRTIAFRVVAEQDGVRIYIDYVALQSSRAFASLIVGSGLVPVPKPEEVQLARLVATRMATAMRGS